MSTSLPDFTPESRLRMTGGRYEEGDGYPIDGLPELIQYEKLVVDVAKAIWLAANVDRRRVPRGFSQVVSLRLKTVRTGSKTPILTRPTVQNTLPDVDPPLILDQAQDMVDRAFEEIVAHNRLPAGFPNGLTNHFVRLGRTLKGNEAIEFGRPDSLDKARYTQPVRLRFLTASQEEDFPLDRTVVGYVTALDTNSLTFTLTDLDNVNLDGAYADDALTPDLLEVFNRRKEAPVVRLECSLLMGADESVKSIEDVHGLEVFLAAEDVPGKARLLELLRLENGWLDGEGEAPDLLALERTRDLLQAAGEAELPEPGVFPRLDGSIQVQWMTATDVWTATIPPEGVLRVDFLGVLVDSEGAAETNDIGAAVAFFVGRRDEARAHERG